MLVDWVMLESQSWLIIDGVVSSNRMSTLPVCCQWRHCQDLLYMVGRVEPSGLLYQTELKCSDKWMFEFSAAGQCYLPTDSQNHTFIYLCCRNFVQSPQKTLRVFPWISMSQHLCQQMTRDRRNEQVVPGITLLTLQTFEYNNYLVEYEENELLVLNAFIVLCQSLTFFQLFHSQEKQK